MDLVELLGDAREHQRDDGERDDEDELLAERQPAQADGEDHGAEHDAAAEDAPVDGLRRRAVETDQHGAGQRGGRHGEPEQEHRLVAVDLREPAREPRDRQDARPEREPAQHLHEAELALDLGLRARAAVGPHPLDHLRGHGVGDHVLQHDADDDEELRRDVERVLARERDPAAGGAGKNDHAGGDETRADEHIDAPLRAEDRHGVGELAEHHLDGPGQRQPHGDRRQLGRREGQCILDPEGLGDGNEAERAIGVIDHQAAADSAAAWRGSA